MDWLNLRFLQQNTVRESEHDYHMEHPATDQVISVQTAVGLARMLSTSRGFHVQLGWSTQLPQRVAGVAVRTSAMNITTKKGQHDSFR